MLVMKQGWKSNALDYPRYGLWVETIITIIAVCSILLLVLCTKNVGGLDDLLPNVTIVANQLKGQPLSIILGLVLVCITPFPVCFYIPTNYGFFIYGVRAILNLTWAEFLLSSLF